MITGVFFILIILKQLLWTTLIPVWQFPDEQAHFAQVQDIAEGQGILVNAPLSTSKEIAVSEELLGTRRDGFGNNKFTYHPEYNIRYTSGTVGLYESEIKSLPSKYRKELTIKEATAYPPLYYQIESIGYWLVYNGDLIMRIFAVRLINLLFYLFTAVIVLASAKLIFPVSRIKQLTLAVFVMFQPMYSFVFAGVNSDNLYNMLATGVVYLCLNLLLRDWNIKTVTAAVIMVIIGKFIKPQTNLLYLFYIYPLAVQFIFHKNFVKAFLFMILVLLVSFGIIIINIINGSQLLPELLPLSYILHTHINTFVNFFINSIIHIYREIMPWYWGIYRWLSLTYPRPVHRIINWITLFSVIGLIRYLFVMFRKDKGGIFKRPVLFSIYAIAVYSFGLISYNFLFTVSHRFQLGLQGRYFSRWYFRCQL